MADVALKMGCDKRVCPFDLQLRMVCGKVVSALAPDLDLRIDCRKLVYAVDIDLELRVGSW